MTTTYLVTGANRGLGAGLVELIAQRPDVKIYATARDATKADKLQALADKYGNITILTWRATEAGDSAAVAKAIEADGGVLDVVIANAAIAQNAKTVATVTAESIQEHIAINVIGNLHLFQAIYPFIERSQRPGGGVYMPISSQIGSLGQGMAFPTLAYAMSKTALNFLGVSIAKEHEKIKVILVHPGLVKTDMATKGFEEVGLDIDTVDFPGVPVLSVQQSAEKLVAIVDKAEEITSGSFLHYEGTPIGW